jgi:hypothetical protein
MSMGKNWCAFVWALPLLVACKGEDSGSNPDDLRDERFECAICDESQAVFAYEQDQADAADCLDHGGGLNPAVTCMVDGVEYQHSILHFERCDRQPACVDDPAEGGGGATNGLEWDYECFACGESMADGFHDNGVEDATCEESAILPDPIADCVDGVARRVVFAECEGVPPCVAED